jgi:hypothetical protein
VHLAVDLNAENILSSLATDELTLRVEATATVSAGTPICMMALNPHAAQALSIQGTADIMALACAVHVNSDDSDDAMYQNGNGTATAESFCVNGEHSGSNFTPAPKNGCMVENDPLASGFADDWAAAGIDSMPCTYSNLPEINTPVATVTILAPGVYCGGLTIKKGIAQLVAGQTAISFNRYGVCQNGKLRDIGSDVTIAGDFERLLRKIQNAIDLHGAAADHQILAAGEI